jgi:hypothetical protein
MTPQNLMRRIRGHGARLEVVDGALRFTGPHELVPSIKALKRELLAILGSTEGLSFDDCRRLLREWSGVCPERGQREPKVEPEVLAGLWRRLDEHVRGAVSGRADCKRQTSSASPAPSGDSEINELRRTA